MWGSRIKNVIFPFCFFMGRLMKPRCVQPWLPTRISVTVVVPRNCHYHHDRSNRHHFHPHPHRHYHHRHHTHSDIVTISSSHHYHHHHHHHHHRHHHNHHKAFQHEETLPSPTTAIPQKSPSSPPPCLTSPQISPTLHQSDTLPTLPPSPPAGHRSRSHNTHVRAGRFRHCSG